MKSAPNPIFWLSQWSTFQSGPLAAPETHDTCPKPGILAELVVHFPEWTTSTIQKPCTES